MKKIIVLLFMLATALSLVACDFGNQESDHEKVFRQSLINYADTDDANHVTEDVTLSLSSDVVTDAIISWRSSDTSILKIEGNKGIVTRLEEDAVVSLIANVTIDEKEEERIFTLHVLKKAPLSEEDLLTLMDISSVRDLADGIKVKTQGVISDLYQSNAGFTFFLQDDHAGIYVNAPSQYANDLVVGAEISLVGDKQSVNSQVQLTNVSAINLLGTKVIEGTYISNPDLLPNYEGQLVEVTGLLKQSYSNLATKFTVVNEEGTFELVIPDELDSTTITTIQHLLGMKDAGLEVDVFASVYRTNNHYQLLLIDPTNIEVADTVDLTLVESVLNAHIEIPTFPNPVTSTIDLPSYQDIISGVRIYWTSDNEAVISSEGVVTQQEEPKLVRLNYEVKLDGQFIKSGFINVTVGNKGSYEGYYDAINGLSGNALKAELTRIISSNITPKSYGDARYILGESDADPGHAGNALLVYNRASVTGEWSYPLWNREHIWPKSKLENASDSDLHNLKPSDTTINSSRGNLPFVDGSGSYGKTNGGWFPGEEDKGDIARIIFYMNTRWGLTISSQIIGDLEVFIEWHLEDPVDDFERNRNDVIYESQNNRNPFIDHPELVEMIYGSASSTTFVSYTNPFDDDYQFLINACNLSDLNRKRLVV